MPVTRSPSRPPSGSPAYSPTDLPAYRGGSSFSPLSLSPVAWLTSRGSTLYDLASGGTPYSDESADCAYPLDDDGTQAALFGLGFAPASGPDLQIVSYDLGTAATTGDTAVTIPGDPLGTDRIALSGIKQWEWAGISLSGTALDFNGFGALGAPALFWDAGTSALSINLSINASGHVRIGAGGFGAGAVTTPVNIDSGTAWADTVIALYVNASTGAVGLIVNGSDQGYIDGPNVATDTAFTVYLATNNNAGMHPGLDNRVIEHRIRTSSDMTTALISGATTICSAPSSGPVGLREDQSGNGRDATQTTLTARPTWTGDAISYDAVDDGFVDTLPAISGGQIVIASPVGIWIDSLDFAGGTFAFGPDTYTGGPAGLLPLLSNTEMEILILPTAMTSEEQAKVVAYYVARGSAGLITLGAELVTNGGFDTNTDWTKGSGWTISGGKAERAAVADGSLISQAITVTAGAGYLFSYDIDAISGNSNLRFFGGTTVLSANYTTTGTKTGILTAATGNTSLGIAMSTLATGTMTADNVSIREIIMP